MMTNSASSRATNIVDHSLSAVRVILVEDDQDLRLAVADYLRLRGNEVTEVASGLGFYKALSETKFDVAILDVNLPDCSGFDLARGLGSTQGMGVIMLTARAGRDDRIRGYEGGADLYLTKPVDSEELALAVGNLARRVRTGSSAIPEAVGGEAPWKLDLRRRTLTSPEGVPITLSGRETMLMERFALVEGATLSRPELDALFGHVNSDPESRRLDAALRRLRLKARVAGSGIPLQIIHAAGVRFAGSLKVE